ncbi:hypothetical protein BMR1_03g03255 [Babesia microti strain RI]|uniref:Mitochondrial carrier protein n=1 Tax=Babesia microti (strain RI) TaxID=1133968 RepID=A0A1R4AC20_BABMR|nr:hypothetical protein BMR1_03g03255 [Babesia microti strain RI]SJK86557.1 hypothetical protein BMR1_03g03255 [Babesia microti strain RI]|eukprot:XP_021338701.1 hypothetical protein BMR1_03g03255 [Babesia microti strain RI]
MSDGQSNFAKLKRNLAFLNEKNKNNKIRVSESRLIASLYFSHVLPSSFGKLILAPFTRLSLMQQIGLRSNNLWGNGWKGVHLHLSVGLVYPAVKLLSNRSDSYVSTNTMGLTDYCLRNILSTSFGFFLVYPLDVAYTYIALANHKVTLRSYLRHTFNTQGLAGIYKGCSFGLLATFPYTAIATLINDNLQRRIKSTVEVPSLNIDGKNMDVDKNIIAKKLYPVSFYPWNIIAGSVSSLLALGATYPIDTIRRGYIIGSNGCNSAINSIKSTLKSGIRGMYGGFLTRFLIYIPYTFIYIGTYKPITHLLT